MRVISGFAKGRKLKSSTKHILRPTSDRVKETLFNILAHKIQEVRFLDLFAGTGSIGIEALSRGAQNSVFVEKEASLADLIRKNAQDCGFVNFEVINCDVLRALSSLQNQRRRFDIIFIDPPYRSDLALRTLEMLAEIDLFDDEHLVIVEHSRQLPEQIVALSLQRIVKFGDTFLSFYRK